MNTKQVLEIFVDQGVLDRGMVDDVIQEVSATGKTLIEVLVDFQICNEEQFYHTIASYLGLEYVDLTNFEPPTEVVRLIPAGLALMNRVFPIGVEQGTLQVVFADPLNPETAESLRFSLGKEIQPIVAPVYQIDELIKKNYGTDIGSMDEILAQLGGEVQVTQDGGGIDMKALEAEANATPIIPRRSFAMWT
jgi:type IV pilus assembly protein PilB